MPEIKTMRLIILFRQMVLVWLLILVITPVPGADDAALTNEDILRLNRAGLETEIIIAIIRSGTANFDMSEEQLVALREAGIADSVIAAMMGKGIGAPSDAEKLQEDKMTCADKPEGSACWMELEDQPGCYIWNPSLIANSTVTWSGRCANGLAEGMGKDTWDLKGDGEIKNTNTGQFKGGKRHGRWVMRSANDAVVYEGSFVDGKKSGQWVSRSADGAVSATVTYVGGMVYDREYQ